MANEPAPIRLRIRRQLAGMNASSPTSFWNAWSCIGGGFGAGTAAARAAAALTVPVASDDDDACAGFPLVASGLVSDYCSQRFSYALLAWA